MRETRAIEQLWNEAHDLVFSFLKRRCNDHSVAEDLTTETFIHAARAMDAGHDVNVAWLMTVARRRLIDHWRSRERSARLLDRLRDEHLAAGTVELTTSLESELEGAIGTLCNSQRSALQLRYLTGHSVGQVADRLQLSYSATESLLARGRRRLAAEYAH